MLIPNMQLYLFQPLLFKEGLKDMKLQLLLVLVLVLGVISCRDSTEICGVSNPVEGLPWLKAYIGQHQEEWSQSEIYDVSIYQASYQGETVFYTSFCCLTCLMLPPPLVNCPGDTLGNLGTDISPNDLKNLVIIYNVDNGICN